MHNVVITKTKICKKCKEEKDSLLFSRNKLAKDGLYPTCKKCMGSNKRTCARCGTNRDCSFFEAGSRKCFDCTVGLHTIRRMQINKHNKKLYSKEGYLRKRDLLYNKGITLEEYATLYERQGGKCAICDRPEEDFARAFAVDHDHSCCKNGCPDCIRGLLCSGCNTAEGLIGGDPDRMFKMIEYLGYDLRSEVDRYLA